jgi:hypothetical protein
MSKGLGGCGLVVADPSRRAPAGLIGDTIGSAVRRPRAAPVGLIADTIGFGGEAAAESPARRR